MKFSLFAILVVLGLNACTLTKRKYMSGWHFEKIHKKTTVVSNTNEAVANVRKNSSIKPANTKLTNTNPHFLKDSIRQAKSEFLAIEKKPLFEPPKALSPEKEVLKLPAKLNQYIKNNTAQKAAGTTNNRSHILLTYSVFLLGLTSLALVITSLINGWGIAAFLVVAGLILLALSIAMSASFLQDIRDGNSTETKWPYKIIIAFGAMILSLLITGILILILYLIISGPPLITIIISASLCFVVCMAIMLRPLLTEKN